MSKSKHDIHSLLGIFEVKDIEAWWESVVKELNNKDLRWTIENDLSVRPMSMNASQRKAIIWSSCYDWKIVETVTALDELAANLEEGFEIDEFVIMAKRPEDLSMLENIPQGQPVSLKVPAVVLPAITNSNLEIDFIRINPMTREDHDHLSSLDLDLSWRYATAPINTTPSDRLTTILSQLNTHLSESPANCQNWRIFIKMNDLFFEQIVELRALKILILNLWQAYGLPVSQHPKIYVNVEPDPEYDLYTNLMRSTTQSVSAILGGIDALTFQCDKNLPYFGDYRRLSRNIHYILKYEANFHHRIDPLAGSFSIENATEVLAEKTWIKMGGLDPLRASE